MLIRDDVMMRAERNSFRGALALSTELNWARRIVAETLGIAIDARSAVGASRRASAHFALRSARAHCSWALVSPLPCRPLPLRSVRSLFIPGVD